VAPTITYPCGSPVRDGDAVFLEESKSRGTIVEVVETIEEAKAQNVSGPGVIVDVDPRGLLFLSVDLIAEEPLVLLERGPDESSRFQAQAVFAAGGVILIPALWSFAAAMYSALTTGEVMVVSLGARVEYEDVSWRMGWARFAGPPVLLCALWLGLGSRVWSRPWWLAAAGCAGALGLLAFSLWFTSLERAIAFVAFSTIVMAAFYVDKLYGRAAALAVVGVAVAIAAWSEL